MLTALNKLLYKKSHSRFDWLNINNHILSAVLRNRIKNIIVPVATIIARFKKNITNYHNNLSLQLQNSGAVYMLWMKNMEQSS